jgi:hypothetical protein
VRAQIVTKRLQNKTWLLLQFLEMPPGYILSSTRVCLNDAEATQNLEYDSGDNWPEVEEFTTESATRADTDFVECLLRENVSNLANSTITISSFQSWPRDPYVPRDTSAPSSFRQSASRVARTAHVKRVGNGDTPQNLMFVYDRFFVVWMNLTALKQRDAGALRLGWGACSQLLADVIWPPAEDEEEEEEEEEETQVY